MLAYLNDGTRNFFARSRAEPFAPSSAVVKLIQGLYDYDPGFARRIVRNRIFSTQPFTAMCFGMIRVAGHRATENAPLPEIKADWIEIAPHAPPALVIPKSRLSPIGLAKALADEVPREGERFALSRAIGAVLVSRDGEMLGAAVNANAKNKTRHAEVNLIQGFYESRKRAIPKGAQLYTTLKPCRMCAGMLWQAAEDPFSLKIHYTEFDPGPNARETILNARSHDRRRFASENLDAELERLLV